jgi:hypothetical protein
MKTVYNKETYNEDGKFYRTEKNTWGIEVADDFSKRKENFTEKVPKGLGQDVIPKQHFDEKSDAWVLDE